MTNAFLTKVRNALSVLVLMMGLGMGSAYFYSAYIEEPYVTYTPLPFPMPIAPVYPGGVATAVAKRCNSQSTPLSYKSTRQIKRENSNEPAIILDSVLITIPPGCTSVSTRVNVVPETTQPGFYRFSGTAMVKGLIVYHEVGWNTDVFEVKAKPPSAAPATPLVLPIANATVKIEVKK